MNNDQDLAVEAFLTLRELFFDVNAIPHSFNLRDKGITQDDPFDEYIAQSLKRIGPDVECIKASSLTTPDLVLMRPALCQGEKQEVLRFALDRIIGIEVKKLGVTKSGIARATGLDYNSTPPSDTVRVYDKTARPLDIYAYYLFVSEEPDKTVLEKKQVQVTSLALCDGGLLNDNFRFYLDTIKPRPMERNKGSYGDGGIRRRPMVVFPNPLSFDALFHHATLIHTRPDLESRCPNLKRIMTIQRKGASAFARTFYAYRLATDVSQDQEFTVQDPFATVQNERQGMRGRLELGISIITELPPEQSDDIALEPGEPT